MRLIQTAPIDVTPKVDESLTRQAPPVAEYSPTTAATSTTWQLILSESNYIESDMAVPAPQLLELRQAQPHHQCRLHQHLHNSSNNH